MSATLRRHARAALSRGPGYEAQPFGVHFDDTPSAGYLIDFSRKTEAASAGDPSGLPPAGLAQLALGWWERAIGGEQDAYQAFDEIVRQLVERSVRIDDSLIWVYDMPVPKYGLTPPWNSAMAQGQAASVLVRAATRDASSSELAVCALQPLLKRQRPFVVETVNGPTLEEAPTAFPSRILNGWIYALWGVWDVARGLDHVGANALFESSAQALRQTIDAYDTGWWSRYSLLEHETDLAKPFYHRLHVAQLEGMYRITGWREFQDVSRRWRAYDTRRAASRAVLFKAVEVARR